MGAERAILAHVKAPLVTEGDFSCNFLGDLEMILHWANYCEFLTGELHAFKNRKFLSRIHEVYVSKRSLKKLIHIVWYKKKTITFRKKKASALTENLCPRLSMKSHRKSLSPNLKASSHR